jgi:glycosyltransferase involved in cell wall biosynthesis
VRKQIRGATKICVLYHASDQVALFNDHVKLACKMLVNWDGDECRPSSLWIPGSRMKSITQPYLLTVAAHIRVDHDGVRWADPLWAKDLALHLDYIENLTLACPRVYADHLVADVALIGEPFDRIKFVELPRPKNHLDAILMLPETIKKIWGAVGSNGITHTGFGGWPISEGLLAAPIARMRGKFLITNVESSFWRIDGGQEKWFNVIRAALIERLNRLCIRAADLRFFTSKAYLREFLEPGAPHAYVAPATWIDSSTILDNDAAIEDWAKKTNEIKLLFAGRLTREKGVSILLDAVRNVNLSNASIAIIGEGPLRTDCENLALHGQSRVSILEPVPYGQQFFNLLRQFDAVIVPSISDEQPRIIFDAFSQGVPVLGSDTGGIREVVDDGVNGRLIVPGSAAALSGLMEWAGRSRSDLRTMGLAALEKSRAFTHRSMHEQRCNIILSEMAISKARFSC